VGRVNLLPHRRSASSPAAASAASSPAILASSASQPLHLPPPAPLTAYMHMQAYTQAYKQAPPPPAMRPLAPPSPHSALFTTEGVEGAGGAEVSAPGRSTAWLLVGLRPTAPAPLREEAARELRRLAKTAEDSYWARNYAQITAVLLESFAPAANVGASGLASLATLPASLLAPAEEASSDWVVFKPLCSSIKSLLLLVRYRGPLMKVRVLLLLACFNMHTETRTQTDTHIYIHTHIHTPSPSDSIVSLIFLFHPQ
jgi:hypothetical protein